MQRKKQRSSLRVKTSKAQGGSGALKKRLGDDVEEFDHSIFGTRSNESLAGAWLVQVSSF
jgi:hypothetical protein